MAHIGDEISNPATHETMTFLQTALSTQGRLLQIQHVVRSGHYAPVVHLHPRQVERFHVVSGTLRAQLDGEWREFGAGQSAIVPAGVPHTFTIASDCQELTMILELEPAFDTEIFFETLFGLAREGRTNKHGAPSILQIAALIQAQQAGLLLAGMPRSVQHVLFTSLAALAEVVGIRGWYARFSPTTLEEIAQLYAK